MRPTLSLEILDLLERTSSSVFVHAFLIRHIADSAAGNHRLSLCARRFTSASAKDLTALKNLRPDASAIIAALRTAEQARLSTVQLTERERELPSIVERLRVDPSEANLQAWGTSLSNAANQCPASTTVVCNAIKSVISKIEVLHQRRRDLEKTVESARQAAEEVARVANDKLSSLSNLQDDSLRLRQLSNTTASSVDSTAIKETLARIDQWKRAIDVQKAKLDTLQGIADSAVARRSAEATRASAAEVDLSKALSAVEAELRADLAAAKRFAALEGSRIGAQLAVLSTPPVTSAANPAARSGDLMVELTDFIIERARRELVNSFVVNLHQLLKEEPLMSHGFPDTWGLMRSLRLRDDGTLDAVDVGRVPLNAWRATLAGDFVMLPINLLDEGYVAICSEEKPDTSRKARAKRHELDSITALPDSVLTKGQRDLKEVRAFAAKTRKECREKVAMLRPLAPIARRLFDGDPIFDVLRDAASLVPSTGADLPKQWRHLPQGLRVVAALAESYAVQGHAPQADAIRHPYILTARSVTQVTQDQRNAFIRLLLVRAIEGADIPTGFDPAVMENAIVTTTRLLERIASRPPVESKTGDAAFLVRTGFEALMGAADFARLVAPAEDAAKLDTIRIRWRAVAGALEPIVARDFGLALSRTTVLLRDLRGVEVPGPLFTFAALASSLSEAESGEQVKKAFETAASPVGGWQSKRYGEGGGSLTAFPGLAFGWERVRRESGDPSGINAPTRTLGAALPVGVEWQFRTTGKDVRAGKCVVAVCGVGVFVPLVDLGALLSYRFGGSDSVQSAPNTTVRQVFAPGAFVSLALTRTVPANILIGAQFVPALRTVGTSSGSAERSAVRYGISIGMDVLLVDF